MRRGRGNVAAAREVLARDRLARAALAAQVPPLWLAVALADPWLLALGPAAAGLLAVLFRHGPLERFEEPDELL